MMSDFTEYDTEHFVLAECLVIKHWMKLSCVPSFQCATCFNSNIEVCITIYCRIDILSQALLSADGASEVCFVLTDVLFVDLQDKSRWLIRHYQCNCLQLPVGFSKSSHVWFILWTHFLLCSTYSSNRSSVSIFLCSHTAHAWHYCLQNVVIRQCRGSHRYHYSYCYRYHSSSLLKLSLLPQFLFSPRSESFPIFSALRPTKVHTHTVHWHTHHPKPASFQWEQVISMQICKDLVILSTSTPFSLSHTHTLTNTPCFLQHCSNEVMTSLLL